MTVQAIVNLNERQSRIISPKLREAPVWVVGLGMVGSWVVQALARTAGKVTGFDFDEVGQENVGSQNYLPMDIERSKAEATEAKLLGLPYSSVGEEFPLGHFKDWPDVLVSCVDSMKGREELAVWCRDRGVPLFLDCRVLGETAALLAASSPEGYERYLRERIVDDKRVPDVLCGEEGTAYTGMWLASRVVPTINNWYRGTEPEEMVLWHVGANASIRFD